MSAILILYAWPILLEPFAFHRRQPSVKKSTQRKLWQPQTGRKENGWISNFITTQGHKWSAHSLMSFIKVQSSLCICRIFFLFRDLCPTINNKVSHQELKRSRTYGFYISVTITTTQTNETQEISLISNYIFIVWYSLLFFLTILIPF